jgi:ribosomal protein S18 acetylase RimI-like enzyme
MTASSQAQEITQHLPDGLILRRPRADEADVLADFNGIIHGQPDRPSQFVRDWSYDLATRPHPTFGQGGFVVVEDPATGHIVSSLNLIPQQWTYAGIPFGVGRIELVGTLPEYRRRGLVRRQMDVAHEWSAANGDLIQIITGIPYFYRQFGYEQGLHMGGARAGYPHLVPALPEGETEPFRIRPATLEDAPFLAAVEEQGRQRWMLTCPRDEALWRHDIAGWGENSLMQRFIGVIERHSERVGYLVMHGRFQGETLCVYAFEILQGQPEVSWLTVTPSVLRYVKSVGDAHVREHPDQPLERIEFQLGLDHPAYHAAPQRLPEVARQFVNYVRVPNLPAFIRHIAPVLEARLARSVAAGHTGKLRLSFFRDGLRLTFQGGRITDVMACPHSAPNGEHRPIGATFPDLAFLQLLFCMRSLDELEYAFGDCRARQETARVLLNALFPKLPSLLWPIR